MCGMRARRVEHCQTLGTAVRSIGAHFRGSVDKSYRRRVMRIRYTTSPARYKPYVFIGQANQKNKKKTIETASKRARGRVTLYDITTLTRPVESRPRATAPTAGATVVVSLAFRRLEQGGRGSDSPQGESVDVEQA